MINNVNFSFKTQTHTTHKRTLVHALFVLSLSLSLIHICIYIYISLCLSCAVILCDTDTHTHKHTHTHRATNNYLNDLCGSLKLIDTWVIYAIKIVKAMRYFYHFVEL